VTGWLGMIQVVRGRAGLCADGQGVRGRGRVCVCRWPGCARKRNVCEVGQSVFRMARRAYKSGVTVRRQDVFKRKDLLIRTGCV
jgi:hypothetical protein